MGTRQTRSDTTSSITLPTGQRKFTPPPKMNMWAKIKQRLNKDRRRIVKQKAIAGIELVGAGAALTGGSILMEKMIESPPGPQVTGHDNIYAADSSPSFIKIESLAGEDDMSTLEITGWIIFSVILMLLTIPVV